MELRKNTEPEVLESLEQELIQMGLGPSAKSWIQEMKTVERKWCKQKKLLVPNGSPVRDKRLITAKKHLCISHLAPLKEY